MALGLIKEPTDTVVTCLSSTLDDVDQRVRNFSAIGLDSIGQAAKKAIPDLIKVLDDLVPEGCANAAEALGLIGTPSKQAVPSLLKLLLSQYAQVRGNATGALGRIGKPAEPAILNPETKKQRYSNPQFICHSLRQHGGRGRAGGGRLDSNVK